MVFFDVNLQVEQFPAMIVGFLANFNYFHIKLLFDAILCENITFVSQLKNGKPFFFV